MLARGWQGLARHKWAGFRMGSAGEGRDGPANAGTRLLLAAAFFGAAFAIDLRTNRQFSPVLGSAAIYESALALFPAIRPGLIATTAHGGIWAGFNVARAFADDTGLRIVDVRLVSNFERWLFGGRLPSSMLQNHFFDPTLIQPRDVALGLVHASFFVVPHGIAALTWFRRRDVYVRYQMATASCFSLSLAAFIVLPAAPPWMSDPDRVTRITHRIVTQAIAGTGSGRSAGPGEAFWFEPNAVAAMPSVHVAAAVLVFLALGSLSRRGRGIGALYALAMSVAVVYLGEHFVLDVVAGWLVALVAWRLARGLAAS
ncbi:MAG: phosphatase PAP2 family protein [Chloroflexia bacterium]|nr:phosphatase PAP2 family protein [Chloroflexia bacterium]